MTNLEARKLVNTTNTVAAMHFQDGMILIQFVGHSSIAARRATSDDDCMACLRILIE